jgi:hypothetical protein
MEICRKYYDLSMKAVNIIVMAETRGQSMSRSDVICDYAI